MGLRPAWVVVEEGPTNPRAGWQVNGDPAMLSGQPGV